MFRRYFLVGFLFLLAGCATPPQIAPLTEPAAVAQEIAAESVGDFYVGRRIYCPPFAMWGYVRSPRQSWRTAKLVILNEKYQFAPDRARNQIGSDNESEYRLYGYFTGDQIYDASSGRFCAEFVLKRSELISANPDRIWSAYFIRDRQMFLGWPRGGTQPRQP
jgi:hypothetical protein